jgi:hypothetical protein
LELLGKDLGSIGYEVSLERGDYDPCLTNKMEVQSETSRYVKQ